MSAKKSTKATMMPTTKLVLDVAKLKAFLKAKTKEFIDRDSLARRWKRDPTTVVRIMEAWGYSGIKLGDQPQSTRLFDLEDVLRVEKLAAGPKK